MKLWKHTLLSAMAFLGVTSTVLYTACEKDACLELKCRNGAPCVDGFCKCPEGYEGVDCNSHPIDRFIGFYSGTTTCDNNPYILDSARIFPKSRPDIIEYFRYSNEKRKYSGKIKSDGDRLIINDEATGERFELVEDVDRITVYTQELVDGTMHTCTFSGKKEY